MKLETKPIVLSLGILFSLLHLIGVLLINLTNGSILSFWQRMHLVSLEVNILEFNILTLISGTVIAFIIGSVIGYIFTSLYKLFAQ